MKKIYLLAAASACALITSCAAARAGSDKLLASGLRTDLIEFTEVDYGEGGYARIASLQPRFSWVVPSAGDGTEQTAYRIVLDRLTSTGSSGMVKSKVWDSGWVSSAQSVAVPYGGEALKADADYG